MSTPESNTSIEEQLWNWRFLGSVIGCVTLGAAVVFALKAKQYNENMAMLKQSLIPVTQKTYTLNSAGDTLSSKIDTIEYRVPAAPIDALQLK